MTEKLFEEAKKIARYHLHTLYGFVAISFLIIVSLSSLYRLILEDKIRFLHYGYFFLVVEGVLFVWWLVYKFWIRKCNKDMTGVVICIYADTTDAEQALKKDFITSLRQQLGLTDELSSIFNVNVIKNHIAKKYNTPDSIKRLHKRTKGHIYIFGETKKRLNGDEQYFMSLSGWVLHKPVPKAVSDELSKDFTATLPHNINFSEIFAFKGFTVTADIVTKSVQFIAGIASFISDNPVLALKLHTNLRSKLVNNADAHPTDKLIRSKLDTLLADEHSIMSAYFFQKDDKQKTNEHLENARSLNPKCYRVHILDSLIAFCWENDAKKSLNALKECHKTTDPLWRYNDAFLRFWLGQYPSAWKQCEKIKKQNYLIERAISQEVTEFNEKLIRDGQSKPVLRFWLAFNYYFKQDNSPQALPHLEYFLNNTDANDKKIMFLRQKASGWLSEVNRQGGWS